MSIPAEQRAQIDPDADRIVRRLVRHGYKAYLVGGCVRDLLLLRKPKDFDVATSATPQETKALFRNCRIIGRRFRLAHIFFGSKIIETATFRKNPQNAVAVQAEDTVEELIEDGVVSPVAQSEVVTAASDELLIRQDNVFGTEEEDALRRDFTINGLFYDVEAETVIDYVNGLPDLTARLVRTIGEPDVRFAEDPIRILRAIKFASRLSFGIEPATYAALLRQRVEIPKSAPARVLEEIFRLFRQGAGAPAFKLLIETEVFDVLIPPLAALFRGAGGEAMRASLHAALAQLDERVQAGFVPSNGFVLSLLVAPLLPSLYARGEGDARPLLPNELFALLDERVQPIFFSMKAARRDVERARQILLAQLRIAPSRRKRTRPMSLVRRDFFDEALLFFEISFDGTAAETGEIVSYWRKLAAEGGARFSPELPGQQNGVSTHSDEPPSTYPRIGPQGQVLSDPAKRRRRRRGGRGRKREPGVGEGKPMDEPASDDTP